MVPIYQRLPDRRNPNEDTANVADRIGGRTLGSSAHRPRRLHARAGASVRFRSERRKTRDRAHTIGPLDLLQAPLVVRQR
jgi:hypothetical protein